MRDNDFALLDNLLNKRWRVLKEIANRAQFQVILEDQRKWNKTGRDIDADYIRYLDPSLSKLSQFKIVLLSRIYYFNSLIKFLDNHHNYPAEKLRVDLGNYDASPVLSRTLNKILGDNTSRQAARKSDRQETAQNNAAQENRAQEEELKALIDTLRSAGE